MSWWIIFIILYSKNTYLAEEIVGEFEEYLVIWQNYPPELMMYILKQISRNSAKFSSAKHSCYTVAKYLKFFILRLEQNAKTSKLSPFKLTHFMVSPSGLVSWLLYWSNISILPLLSTNIASSYIHTGKQITIGRSSSTGI